jgi:hypothetical protein
MPTAAHGFWVEMSCCRVTDQSAFQVVAEQPSRGEMPDRPDLLVFDAMLCCRRYGA